MINWSAPQALIIAIVGLLVGVVGLSMIAGARKAKMHEVASTSIVTIVGIGFVALGLGATAWITFGSRVLSTIGLNTNG